MPEAADGRLAASVIERMRQDIEANEGGEVLWIGHVNSHKFVLRITAAARGNDNTVPALFPHMERGDVVLHNHPSGRLQPSGADLGVASQLGQQGIGFYIVNNQVTEINCVTEPLVLEDNRPLDIPALASNLEPGGSLAQLVEGFESRPAQVELLKLIAQGFNDSSIVAAEAGTGVGKSFAYLIPSLAWVKNNPERVVISTATINLQQQLMEKDLPRVQKMLGTDLKVVLVKGRGNYLCPHRLEEELREAGDTGPDAEVLKQIAEWAESSKTGSKSDLGFLPPDSLWSRICSEADACRGLKCGLRDTCFLSKARKEAASARILVANHHLLFADLSLRLGGFGFENTAIMPPFQRLVMDEAHGIEKSATSYFSSSFSRPSVMKTVGRIFRTRKGRNQGLAVNLQGLKAENIDFTQFPLLHDQLQKNLDAFNTLALAFLDSQNNVRLKGEPSVAVYEHLLTPLQSVRATLLDLIHLSKRLAECYKDDEDELPEVFELRSIAGRMEEAAAFLTRFNEYWKDGENVTWLERVRDFRGEGFVQLIISPLNVSKFMLDAVFEPYPTVVFTSATLTIRNKFTFWSGRLGLSLIDKARLLAGIFPSPFDYANRVLLASPSDFPQPKDPDYLESLAQAVGDLVTGAGGSALVLFTSFEALNFTYNTVKPRLDERGIAVFRQGDDDRARLLDLFKNDISSVLFGTESFWEGVDSPGDTLRLVIICKLPFRVPSDPILSARMEVLEAQGRDSFTFFSLPDAVTRFKQGFGRLMRRHNDSGAVVVLDSRLTQKQYGNVFVEALPETRRAFGTSREVLKEVVGFLKEQR